MQIQLIQGEFSTGEALELITQMIHVKIQYHESKISKDCSEDDIKFRESKIKMLQKELYELRRETTRNTVNLKLNGNIQIEKI